jgi:hypothetical protein
MNCGRWLKACCGFCGVKKIPWNILRFISRPDVINGDPDDLVHINWEKELNLDLPGHPRGSLADQAIDGKIQ